MKKITLLIALFMLCQYSMKADSNSFLQHYYIYVTTTSGEAGSTAELTLNIHNNNPINYWKCDLILPEGFTLKSAAPVKDRWPEEYDPIITTNANDDGSVTIFNNFNNDAEDVSLTGTDGPVATVTVDIANTVSSGKYTITLRNIYLEEPNGTIIWKESTCQPAPSRLQQERKPPCLPARQNRPESPGCASSRSSW